MRTQAAALVLVVAVAATACQAPSDRKTAAQLVGDTMFAGVSDVVEAETLKGRGRKDPDRPYRRATVLHDARVSCTDDRRPDASCGAIVEIYRQKQTASDRAQAAMRSDGRTVQRGRYVLRVSPELDQEAAGTYRAAFLETLRARQAG